MSTSPMERRNHKTMRDGIGRFKSGGWRPASPRAMKILSWNCRGVGNPVTVRELKQLLVANVPDVIFLCKTKIHSNGFSRIHSMCGMEGCLVVRSKRKSGGLELIWREGIRVTMQNYSKYHIDSLVSMDDGETFRFTGFYGQTDPNLRQQSWDMLRRVKSTINEGWIVGGDFKAILNNFEKEGGRRKPKSSMDDFGDILEELNLTDVKTCNGWFTWTNNKKGNRLAILMDTNGNKPKEKNNDPRAWFRYDICCVKEQEARDISTSIWSNGEGNLLEKMELIRDKLGP
ncbi:hypothetical protein GOBAR_DD02478 [Gossypium barbadense]|nr:hypothetical protein GOBAR_DD02478 [Gossypium barbadense]